MKGVKSPPSLLGQIWQPITEMTLCIGGFIQWNHLVSPEVLLGLRWDFVEATLKKLQSLSSHHNDVMVVFDIDPFTKRHKLVYNGRFQKSEALHCNQNTVKSIKIQLNLRYKVTGLDIPPLWTTLLVAMHDDIENASILTATLNHEWNHNRVFWK